jgi:hypothetical protein
MAGLKLARLMDSSIAVEHGIKSLPAVLFYRHGIPIIFDGRSLSKSSCMVQCVLSAADHFNHQDILYWMEQVRTSAVQALNDDNFEHLTQAVTGSSTGDWFINL